MNWVENFLDYLEPELTHTLTPQSSRACIEQRRCAVRPVMRMAWRDSQADPSAS